MTCHSLRTRGVIAASFCFGTTSQRRFDVKVALLSRCVPAGAISRLCLELYRDLMYRNCICLCVSINLFEFEFEFEFWRHFADDIFKCILLKIFDFRKKSSLKFVPQGLINNIPPLVQIMAWRRPGDKPLSEPIMVSLYASLGLHELNPVHAAVVR